MAVCAYVESKWRLAGAFGESALIDVKCSSGGLIASKLTRIVSLESKL